jgi:hypothetical protein
MKAKPKWESLGKKKVRAGGFFLNRHPLKPRTGGGVSKAAKVPDLSAF